jgi:type II secretory pathway pseudopilin PulG
LIRRLAAVRREEGVTMVLMVLIVALLGIVSLALLGSVQGESHRANDAVARDAAFQAAEAGIHSYMSKLVDDTVFYNHYLARGESTRRSSGGVVVTGSGSSNVTWTYGLGWTYPNGFDKWFALGNGYEYSLQITPPNPGSSAIDIVAVGRPVGSTTNNRKIETLVRPANLTDFQMLSNADITYNEVATTKGKIYAGKDANGIRHNVEHNGTATADVYAEGDVTGSTTFVSPAKKYDDDTNPTIRSVIANPVNFASFMASLVDIAAASQAAGVYLNDSSVAAWWLEFKNNGDFTVKKCTQSGGNPVEMVQPTCTYVQTYHVPANGAIYVGQTAIVSNQTTNGGVLGRVTVASNNNIVVANNVGPVTPGTDVLGLIAANEMIVAKWCPTNLTWRAATISEHGMFRSAVDKADGHGTMTFIGSTATYGGKYCVGTTCYVIGGYMSMFGTARNYEYDETLLYLQPPWFPTLGDSLTMLLFRELPA